jgi:hypothetical protein
MRAAGLPNSEDQVVGANRLFPRLELIQAIFRRADDQPVLGRYLEREVFGTFHLLDVIVGNVGAVQ